MPFNKKTLYKGIKYFTATLPLLVLGPIFIDNSQKNLQSDWHYLVLSIGIIACLSAMILLFLGAKTVVDSLFDK